MKQRHFNFIRKMRREHTPPWRQRDLAEAIGVCPSDLAAYERGEVTPTLPRCLDIAHALGQPVEAVFWQLRERSKARVLGCRAASTPDATPRNPGL